MPAALSQSPRQRQRITAVDAVVDRRELPVAEQDRIYDSVVLHAPVWGYEVWPTGMVQAPWIGGSGGMVRISVGNTIYVEDDDGPLHQVIRWASKTFRVRARALVAAAKGEADSPFVDPAA